MINTENQKTITENENNNNAENAETVKAFYRRELMPFEDWIKPTKEARIKTPSMARSYAEKLGEAGELLALNRKLEKEEKRQLNEELKSLKSELVGFEAFLFYWVCNTEDKIIRQRIKRRLNNASSLKRASEELYLIV